MSKRQMKDFDRKVKAALSIITAEEAEAVVGEDAVARKLLDGVYGVVGLLWVWIQTRGPVVKADADSIKFINNSQALLLQLIFNAYALGKRRKG